MLDDLTKEIKAQLYERVKSPLFGAFAFSWVVWNYRALLAAVADLSFKDRMAYLDGLYPSLEAWGWYCLGGPLLTALGFLVVYPWPARLMYWYWAYQQKELKKIQQSIEDEMPLTQEEAKALRKTSLSQVAEVENRLREMMQVNREMTERLKQAEEDIHRITLERDQFEMAALKADEQLVPLREKLARQNLAKNRDGLSKLTIYPATYPKVSPRMELVSEAQMASLAQKIGEDKSAQKLFFSLLRYDGEAVAGDLFEDSGLGPLVAQKGIERLVKQGVVVKHGERWALSSEGADIALSLKLTD